MSIRRMITAYAFIMFFVVIAILGTASASLGGGMYTEVVGRQSTYTLSVATARGTIYDRNGKPLTNAEEKYIAAVVPNVESVSRLNAAAGRERREELRVALENGKPFLIEVNTPVHADGIETFRVYNRYAEHQPAANIIGYLENGETGADGIEKSCDSMLAASNGTIDVTVTIDALGNAITGAELLVDNTYQIADGGVVLTLDRDIQLALEKACASIEKGAAVVLDCKTGDILACASFPAVDPNNLDACLEDADAPFLNRALSAYAPGSVFKLFVAAAALEAGADYRESYECTGSIEVDGMEFACYDGKAHGEVNMHTALRKSCNGYFVELMEKLEPDRVLRMVHGTADANLEIEKEDLNEGYKVMEPTTANRLRAYMESTARYGTGISGAPQNCTSGIKTGTAQTGVYEESGDEILNYWYTGYICDSDDAPAYTIVILEETAGESHTADAFQKTGEALVDFI